jgi:hypothetical protein
MFLAWMQELEKAVAKQRRSSKKKVPDGQMLLCRLLEITEKMDFYAVTRGEADLQVEVHKLLAFLVHVVQVRKAFRLCPGGTLESIAQLLQITRNALHQRLKSLGLSSDELRSPDISVDSLLAENGELADIIDTLKMAAREFEVPDELAWPEVRRRSKKRWDRLPAEAEEQPQPVH